MTIRKVMAMREILYRGKSKRSGEWKYGCLVELGKESFSDPDRYGIAEKAVPLGSNDVCYNLKIDEVIPKTVGQYIGLLDKNGTKIFEGDIVKDDYLFGEVVFATAADDYDGMAGFMVDDIDDGYQNYNGLWHLVEVVGNIHDTPELLRGCKR